MLAPFQLRSLALPGATIGAIAMLCGIPNAQAAANRDACPAFDHTHGAWNTVLTRYVHKGSVDYAGLSRSGRSALGTYLHALESTCKQRYVSWSRAQKLAFWINAYNAYTLKLVLDNYPLKSIRSIGAGPGAAFGKRFISLKSLRGKLLSLNDIENEILRKEFREPRIHFAIVCASKSCPELRAHPYRATMLEAQLSQAVHAFLADTSKNRFDVASHTLYLSAIFDWFRKDFERSAKTLPAFVARYAPRKIAAALSTEPVHIKFLDYDWSLNGK